jgi:hypothetical protein
MYDHYAEVGRRFFEMVPLREADFAILPVAWENALGDEQAKNLALRFAEAARQAGKRVVVFFWSDSDEPVPIENAFVFRTSFYRTKRKVNEFAQPSWSEDFVQRYLGSQLPLRPKREKPRVGFCGYAGPQGLSARHRVAGALSWGLRSLGISKTVPNQGAKIRAKAMRILSRSPMVETNFVVRDAFLGGGVAGGKLHYETLHRARRAYVQNMVDSDYVLCARGAGNFSYRLYETLSCGRIPLFIDSDCVLPYDWLIDWKQHSVWVDASDLGEVAKRVAAFHEALSPQAFRDLQVACRKLWDDWLSPEAFFANFHRHFQLRGGG